LQTRPEHPIRLRERHVDLQRRIRTQAEEVRIRDDADDDAPRLSERDLFADRIVVAEQSRRGGLREDDDARRAGPIDRREIAAAEQRNAQRGKVAGAHEPVFRAAGLRAIGGRHDVVEASLVERCEARHRRSRTPGTDATAGSA
jgi:hypothetical protein